MIAEALRQLAALLALALAPALVSALIQLKPTDRAPMQDEVTASAAQSWGKKVQWVDARPRAKFEQGHIPGAFLLNEDEWDRLAPPFFDAWGPEKIVIVYCDGRNGDACDSVARRLREELKLENVHILKGGWSAWPRK